MMWKIAKYLLPFLAVGCATSSYVSLDPATTRLIAIWMCLMPLPLLVVWVALARRFNDLSFHFVVVIAFVALCLYLSAIRPYNTISAASLTALAGFLVIQLCGRSHTADAALIGIQWAARVVAGFVVLSAIMNFQIGGILPAAGTSLLASITRCVGLLLVAGILLWIGGWFPGSPGHSLRRPAADDAAPDPTPTR